MAKALPRAVFRFTVPGPVTMPMPALPKRPMGARSVAGGRIATGRDAVEWAREAESRGAGEILLTSMDCDGTRAGFDCPLTAAVATAVNIPVIASGGAGSGDHFVEVFKAGCADAALAASIFH